MHVLVEFIGWFFIVIFELIAARIMRLFGIQPNPKTTDSRKILIGLLCFIVAVVIFLFVYKLFFATNVG